jgi:predicted RNA-binding protein with PIN domain
MSLPDPIVTSIVKGVGAYIAVARPTDVPAALRPLRNKHLKLLMARKNDVLRALEDEGLRALIIDWLDDDPPGISRSDAKVLRVAATRADGWQDQLSKRVPTTPPKPARDPDDGAVEREKQRAKKAKDELKLAKEAASRQVATERARASELDAKVRALGTEIADLSRSLAAVTRERDAAKAEMDREIRKARRKAEKAEASLEESKALVRELRSRMKPVRAEPKPRSPKKPTAVRTPPEPSRRRKLPVPKGRYEDAPETLAEWLSTPHVHLLVDGYNVSKAEGGFGDLALEAQRTRLIQEVSKVARKYSIRATVIFDGSHVAPGTSRRSRGPVEVEYSRPEEIADDHLIARLEGLPKHPVVVTTNDKELQGRAARLGATIARSTQLLALIRGS